jgi:hypothetical protein
MGCMLGRWLLAWCLMPPSLPSMQNLLSAALPCQRGGPGDGARRGAASVSMCTSPDGAPGPACPRQAMLGSLGPRSPAAALAQLRAEVQDLRKYAVLNYVAVIKAIKKRNRHLRDACGGAEVAPLRAVDLLSCQYFFTSPKLAALSTRAEVLAKVRATWPRLPFISGPILG